MPPARTWAWRAAKDRGQAYGNELRAKSLPGAAPRFKTHCNERCGVQFTLVCWLQRGTLDDGMPERMKMTPHELTVDDEVFVKLQAEAIPFLDTPNSVLRRLLELPPNSYSNPAVSAEPTGDASERPVGRRSRQGPRRRVAKGRRAPKGALLDESEYEIPLLESLVELGGRVPTREVLDQLEPKIKGHLTALDQERISSGSVRWKNRAQFVRLTLVKRGDMVDKSPRGIWEITEQGRRRLKEAK